MTTNTSAAARRVEGILQTNSREWLERLRRPKPGDHVGRDCGAADLFRVILAARRPNAGFAALDREFSANRDLVFDVEAGSAEFADPGSDVDYVTVAKARAE